MGLYSLAKCKKLRSSFSNIGSAFAEFTIWKGKRWNQTSLNVEYERKVLHDKEIYGISPSESSPFGLKNWDKVDHDDNAAAVFILGGGKRCISIRYPDKGY